MKWGGRFVISFESFIMEDGMPIYLQIILFVKRGISAGVIADGDELPSRRVLSALLGVNPNTVQKAYRMLEEEGLIQSHSGAKSYVVLNGVVKERIRSELLESDARSVIHSLRQMGLTKEDAVALIEKYWE